MKESKITGLIAAVKKNEDGDAISIKVETEDNSYMVELNEIGKEMLNLVGEKVKVSGIVRTSKSGLSVITASDYEPAEDLDNYEEVEDIEGDI